MSRIKIVLDINVDSHRVDPHDVAEYAIEALMTAHHNDDRFTSEEPKLIEAEWEKP